MAFVIAVIAIAAALGAGVAVFRTAKIGEMRQQTADLRAQVEFEQGQRDVEKREHTAELQAVKGAMAEQDKRCAAELADLRGEVRALTSGLAERIVGAVVDAVTPKTPTTTSTTTVVHEETRPMPSGGNE